MTYTSITASRRRSSSRRVQEWAKAIALGVLASLGATACGNGGLVPEGPADLSGFGHDLAMNVDQRPVGEMDMAASRDMAASADMGAFCGNPNSARVLLNGMLAASPSVVAMPLILNCCDGATMQVISMQVATPLTLLWRHQVGQGPNPPVTLDLANLPLGWSVTLYSGCNPTQPNCQPSDQYSSGLTGTLTVAGNGGSYQMSTCLEAIEDPGNPHPVIHSLRFWSPTVSTP